MERLTGYDRLAGVMTGDLKLGVDEKKAFDRLAAYEDFMERWKLTRIEDADRIFRRVNALGGTDLMQQYRDLGPIDHLRELVQAEKDGRLVVLPCKEGDPIWWIDVAWLPQNGSMYFKISSGTFRYAMLDWQNPIYTSQAEAEAALKKREEADNETD